MKATAKPMFILGIGVQLVGFATGDVTLFVVGSVSMVYGYIVQNYVR